MGQGKKEKRVEQESWTPYSSQWGSAGMDTAEWLGRLGMRKWGGMVQVGQASVAAGGCAANERGRASTPLTRARVQPPIREGAKAVAQVGGCRRNNALPVPPQGG